MDLVISEWPCLGLSQASTSQGLSDPKLRLFWELIHMLQYLHTSQLHSCAYVLKNVPPLEDSQLVVLVAWQQIKPWIREPM